MPLNLQDPFRIRGVIEYIRLNPNRPKDEFLEDVAITHPKWNTKLVGDDFDKIKQNWNTYKKYVSPKFEPKTILGKQGLIRQIQRGREITKEYNKSAYPEEWARQQPDVIAANKDAEKEYDKNPEARKDAHHIAASNILVGMGNSIPSLVGQRPIDIPEGVVEDPVAQMVGEIIPQTVAMMGVPAGAAVKVAQATKLVPLIKGAEAIQKFGQAGNVVKQAVNTGVIRAGENVLINKPRQIANQTPIDQVIQEDLLAGGLGFGGGAVEGTMRVALPALASKARDYADTPTPDYVPGPEVARAQANITAAGNRLNLGIDPTLLPDAITIIKSGMKTVKKASITRTKAMLKAKYPQLLDSEISDEMLKGVKSIPDDAQAVDWVKNNHPEFIHVKAPLIRVGDTDTKISQEPALDPAQVDLELENTAKLQAKRAAENKARFEAEQAKKNPPEVKPEGGMTADEVRATLAKQKNTITVESGLEDGKTVAHTLSSKKINSLIKVLFTEKNKYVSPDIYNQAIREMFPGYKAYTGDDLWRIINDSYGMKNTENGIRYHDTNYGLFPENPVVPSSFDNTLEKHGLEITRDDFRNNDTHVDTLIDRYQLKQHERIKTNNPETVKQYDPPENMPDSQLMTKDKQKANVLGYKKLVDKLTDFDTLYRVSKVKKIDIKGKNGTRKAIEDFSTADLDVIHDFLELKANTTEAYNTITHGNINGNASRLDDILAEANRGWVDVDGNPTKASEIDWVKKYAIQLADLKSKGYDIDFKTGVNTDGITPELANRVVNGAVRKGAVVEQVDAFRYGIGLLSSPTTHTKNMGINNWNYLVDRYLVDPLHVYGIDPLLGKMTGEKTTTLKTNYFKHVDANGKTKYTSTPTAEINQGSKIPAIVHTAWQNAKDIMREGITNIDYARKFNMPEAVELGWGKATNWNKRILNAPARGLLAADTFMRTLIEHDEYIKALASNYLNHFPKASTDELGAYIDNVLMRSKSMETQSGSYYGYNKILENTGITKKVASSNLKIAREYIGTVKNGKNVRNKVDVGNYQGKNLDNANTPDLYREAFENSKLLPPDSKTATPENPITFNNRTMNRVDKTADGHSIITDVHGDQGVILPDGSKQIIVNGENGKVPYKVVEGTDGKLAKYNTETGETTLLTKSDEALLDDGSGIDEFDTGGLGKFTGIDNTNLHIMSKMLKNVEDRTDTIGLDSFTAGEINANKRAQDIADDILLTSEHGKTLKAIDKVIDMDIVGVKPIRWSVPFTKIPNNVMKQAFRYSPGGIIEGLYQFKKLPGTMAERQFTAGRNIAKGTIGTAGAALFMAKVLPYFKAINEPDGEHKVHLVPSFGALTAADRTLMGKKGIPLNSIGINGVYMPIENLGNAGLVISVWNDVNYVRMKKGGDAYIAQALAGIQTIIGASPYESGVKILTEANSANENNAQAKLIGLGNQMFGQVLTPAIAYKLIQQWSGKNKVDNYKQFNPVYRLGVGPEKRDVFGDKVPMTYADTPVKKLTSTIFPITFSENTPAQDKSMLDLFTSVGLAPAFIKDTINKELDALGFKFSPEETKKAQGLFGKYLRENIKTEMPQIIKDIETEYPKGSKGYNTTLKAVVKSIIDNSRAQAVGEIRDAYDKIHDKDIQKAYDQKLLDDFEPDTNSSNAPPVDPKLLNDFE